jgi:hypothetical protein
VRTLQHRTQTHTQSKLFGTVEAPVLQQEGRVQQHPVLPVQHFKSFSVKQQLSPLLLLCNLFQQWHYCAQEGRLGCVQVCC